MKKTEISKFDYKTQKEMLEDYIGQNIVYNEDDYQLLNFIEVEITSTDYKLPKYYIECLLIDKCGNRIQVCVNEIFKICFPQYCKKWSTIPPFIRK